MACLYKRKDSPYFWIKYTKDGTVLRESTCLRTTVTLDVRKARELEAKRTLEEIQEGRPGRGGGKTVGGWAWVVPWLDVRYSQSPGTHERYSTDWKTLKIFLNERRIASPTQLTRQHCFDYLGWRTKPNPSTGKYAACHNTALLELKVLRIIMHEAVERGIIQGNPCVKLGLRKERPALKPEFTAEDDALIRAEIPKVEDVETRRLLETSFEIARYQGCRLTETRLNPMTDVDLFRRTITFRIKGDRVFTTALHPKLVPLFEGLQKERRRFTWQVPATTANRRQWAALKWFNFLKRIGLKKKGITFHGLRVTVVTELARANVPLSKAKKFVGHSSTTVHEIYQRLRPDDVSDVTGAVGG